MARTSKVCEPSVSVAYVLGLEHAVQALPSRRHSKLADGSSAANVKLADVLDVAPSGPVVSTVFGAVVSTTTVREFDAPEVLPAASRAVAV